MLLSLSSLAQNLSVVMMWLLAIIAGKALIVAAVAHLLRYSLRVAVILGLGLAQVGEFSFILAKLGYGQNLISQIDYQLFLAASILSMIATPFLINAAPRIGLALASRLSPRIAGGPKRKGDTTEERALQNHVIVVGYGMNGRNLSKVLHRQGINFTVLELNAETVRAASEQGVAIQYGDAARRQVLQHVGIEKAAIIVFAISDPLVTRLAVGLAHELNPGLHIIVRTRYMSEVASLFELGASEVVPEEFETSVEIFSRVLKQYGISRNVIEREVEEIRKEGYEMLRSSSLPLVEMKSLREAFSTTSTQTIFISSDFVALGKTLKELDLRGRTGATVTAVVRDGNMEINPGPEFKVETDDILILLGRPEEISIAADFIRQGSVNLDSQLI
jgi:CPA2 family monovalent cation:H+ antiporter-2